MNDPHVIALQYNLVFGDTIKFQPPPRPREYVLPGFRVFLDGPHLVLRPTEHYATVDEVQQVCGPALQAWQLVIAMELGAIDVAFIYDSAEIEDRAPKPGVTSVLLESIAAGEAFGIPMVIRTVNEYPQDPDPNFEATPDVVSLWHRYCMYRQGKDQLLSMAYFVLSFLETVSGGGKHEAARRFNIEFKVLAKIGELSSTRGDPLTARKQMHAHQTPLTVAERRWLDHAVQRLILQFGRGQNAPPSVRLALSDWRPR